MDPEPTAQELGDRDSPAWAAIRTGDAETLQQILRTDYDAATRYLLPLRGGITPVCMASMRGHANLIEILSKAGFSARASMADGATPALLAARAAQADCLVALAKSGQVDLDRAATFGQFAGLTPAHTASQTARGATCISVLAGVGADLNCVTPVTNATPAFLAARAGFADVVSALGEHGADLERSGPFGCPPSLVAAHGGHVQVIKVLRRFGVNFDQPDSGRHGLGETAIAQCGVGGDAESVQAMKYVLDLAETNELEEQLPLSPLFTDAPIVTAARVAGKLGHAEAVEEIQQATLEKRYATMLKRKAKEARRRALGY